MNLLLSPYILILIAAALNCALIVVGVWPRRRNNSETLPLILLLLGIIEWILAALAGLLDPDLAHKMLWAKIEYFGVVFVPLAVLGYVLHHLGSKQHMTVRRLALLSIIPLVTLALAWNNGAHGLIWASYIPYRENGLSLSDKIYGPGFWVYWGYSYLLLLAAASLTILSLLRSTRLFRWQNLVVLTGILAPWIGNLLYVLHLNPFGNLDLTPLAFGISGILLSVGMFGWRLFDIKPFAQAAVIASMPDGLIILDNRDRIVDVNPAARQILGQSMRELIGKPVGKIITAWQPQAGDSTAAEPRSFNIKLSGGLGERIYELNVSPFYEKMTTPGGRIIFLHDITHRKELEEKLQESVRRQSEALLQQSENKYANLYQNMPVGVIYQGPHGSVIDMNPAAESFFGIGLPQINDPAGYYAKLRMVYPDGTDFLLEDHPGMLSLKTGQPYRNQVMGIYFPNEPACRWVNINTVPQFRPGEQQPYQVFVTFEDITQARQAAQAREKSEKRFQALVENSLEEISLIDASGDLVWESPTTRRPLGYLPGSFLGQGLSDLVHPDDLPLVTHLYEQTLAEPKCVREAMFRLRHQDGFWHWMEAVLTNLLDEPAVQAVVINYRDVTRRKQAEEKLEGERILLRTLIDNLPDQIYIMDVQGRKIIANLANWQASGQSSMEAIIGKTDLEVFPSELAAAYWVLDKSVIDSGTALINREEPGIDVQGNPSWLLSSKFPLRDGQGKVVGLVGIGRDITERKHAEEQLLFRNAILTATQEASGDGLLVVDENARIVSYNQRFIEMMGLPQELVDQQDDGPVLRFVTNSFADPEAFVEKVRFLYENPGVTAQDELLLKDGRTFDRYSSPIIGPDAVYYGRVWYFRDITERKRQDGEIHARSAELSALYQLSRLLADADDLAAVIELVNRHTVESVHITFAGLALLEGGNLERRAVYPVRRLGADFDPAGRQSLDALPLCQQVLQTNEPLILSADNHAIGIAERRLLLLDFAQSVCLVPLRVGDASQGSSVKLGLLILGEARSDTREPFTPAKLHLARSIGDQAASAIRRVLVWEQAERRSRALTSLSEIDRTIASILDLHVSLQMILRHVCDQLAVDAAAVLVFNETLQTLEYTAGRGFRSPAIRAKHQRLGEGQAGRAALERQVVQVPDVASSLSVFAHPDLLKVEKVSAYFAVPLITKGKVKGVLEVYQRSPLNPDEEWLDFLNSLAGQAAIAIDNVQMFERLQRSTDELEMAYDATIEGWSHALDLRDKETEGHTQRVTQLTVRLARLFGISEADLVQVRWGALLHDIGKMGVPDGILLKPGPLTEEEWVLMKKHPGLAYELLKPISFLHRALDIPYCHHEKWDGSGYPRALKGEHIPLVARIFAVVDVWDAITSDRPYRLAWSAEKARQHIQAGAGTHFDPQVVEKFFQEIG